jgi:hypothetical protein
MSSLSQPQVPQCLVSRQAIRIFHLDYQGDNAVLQDSVHSMQAALRRQGLACYIEKLDFVTLEELTPEHLEQIKQRFRAAAGDYTVFIPGMIELFLTEPDLTLSFSAYRSWLPATRFRTLPHPRSPLSKQLDFPDASHLRWTQKPELSVGFMGSVYNNSGAAKLAVYTPKFLENYFIKAWHLQHIDQLIKHRFIWRYSLFLACAVRRKSVQVLQRTHLKKEVVIRDSNYSGEVDQARAYHEHLLSNTYILCPRGHENWSFRFYEALAYGKVPVLIDSDMLLPPGVDWDALCVRVPYGQIDQLEAFIRQDYDRKTAADFIRRQADALTTMQRLQHDSWLTDLVSDIAKAVS